MSQSKKDKDKDSHQEEVNALKAELKRLKTKEDTNNFQETKIFCSNCNAEVRLGSKFCSKCGTVIENKSSNKKTSKDRLSSAKASTVSDSVEISDLKSKRLRIHKFILGYNRQGYIYLGAFIGTICFGGSLVVSLIALVEGIIYLTMPIDQFKRTYIENKKEWF